MEEERKTCFLCGVDSTQQWHIFDWGDGMANAFENECDHCHQLVEESGEKSLKELGFDEDD
jgi:RNA polymerase subunit RPABC4/transcription elongation factor Spt4